MADCVSNDTLLKILCIDARISTCRSLFKTKLSDENLIGLIIS